MNRNFVAGILIALCVALLAGTVVFLHVMANPGNTFERQLARVQDCMGRKDAISCVRPAIRAMLDMKSAPEVFEDISTHISALRCHYIGHVVGQELYRRTNDIEAALDQCDRSCDSSCVHGAVGEAFAKELGLGDPDDEVQIDLAHLSSDELSTIGRKLCVSGQTCHGVGHALFQATKTLSGALAACTEIITGATSTSCYNGAAMEYSDLLVSRSMRKTPGITYPTVESLPKLCSMSRIEERRACLRYYPRTVIETMTAQGFSQTEASDRVRELCRSFDSDDRVACFFGFGRLNSALITSDPKAANALCNVETSDRDKAACLFGEVSTSPRERAQELVQYCGSVASEFRSACYRGLGYQFYILGESIQNAITFCTSGDMICDQGLKNFPTDPWSYIQKNFNR